MSFQVISEEKKELVREVILKALKDASYKERLVNSPIDAIRELYPTFSVGGKKKLVIVDQSASDTYFINISHLSHLLFGGDVEEFELTEEELEMVAGGKTVQGYSCYILSCFGVEDQLEPMN